jgi:hypothetical protein
MGSPSFFWKPAKHAAHEIHKFISTLSTVLSRSDLQWHVIDRWLYFPIPWGTHQFSRFGGNDMVRLGAYRSHRRGATCAGSVVEMSMVVLRVGIQPHAYDNGDCGNLPRRTRRTDA